MNLSTTMKIAGGVLAAGAIGAVAVDHATMHYGDVGTVETDHGTRTVGSGRRPDHTNYVTYEDAAAKAKTLPGSFIVTSSNPRPITLGERHFRLYPISDQDAQTMVASGFTSAVKGSEYVRGLVTGGEFHMATYGQSRHATFDAAGS